ncbi:MAG: pantoate--beta-alanine ligase [Bacteroidetes bacterium]|nr:pantoate--beta-alanine ligase [Bacteroidota bacterium]
MLIFTKIDELQYFLVQKKAEKKSIGFVPTMGALHAGHISLINSSKKSCDLTVCSIFVNPTQFNDKKDLERYPKTPERDLEMLKKAACDIVFMPSAQEMYPEKDERVFDFGYLDKILEGDHRPGHFNGVAQIVSRLFDIVKPDKAFFGSKDYQQVMIIKALVELLHYTTEIVTCPTLRDPDGLAMSSRNTLLNAKEREVAKIIPKLMQEAKSLKDKGKDVTEIKEHIVSELNMRGNYELDYFTICDARTLKELKSFSEAKEHIALIACYVGKIRLIDNISLN